VQTIPYRGPFMSRRPSSLWRTPLKSP
jgi:hypothetical protein